MKVELRPGLQGRAEAIVDTTNVAAVMGSGDLDVFCYSGHDSPDGAGRLQRDPSMP